MNETRERAPWAGIVGRARRFVVRHTKVAVTTFVAALVSIAIIPWLFGLVVLPSRVAAQSRDVVRMDSTLKVLIKSNDTTRRISALDVSFQCLDADSARFQASWRTCAEALYIARVDPNFWQPRVNNLARRARALEGMQEPPR